MKPISLIRLYRALSGLTWLWTLMMRSARKSPSPARRNTGVTWTLSRRRVRLDLHRFLHRRDRCQSITGTDNVSIGRIVIDFQRPSAETHSSSRNVSNFDPLRESTIVAGNHDFRNHDVARFSNRCCGILRFHCRICPVRCGHHVYVRCTRCPNAPSAEVKTLWTGIPDFAQLAAAVPSVAPVTRDIETRSMTVRYNPVAAVTPPLPGHCPVAGSGVVVDRINGRVPSWKTANRDHPFF